MEQRATWSSISTAHEKLLVPQKSKRATQERIEKFVSDSYFTDVNLYGRLFTHSSPLDSLLHAAVSDRISFSDAQNLNYNKTQVGHYYGPTWSTHWFKINVKIPKEWRGFEVVFRWVCEAEGLLWLEDTPVQGFHGKDRSTYCLTSCSNGDESYSFYIELACNALFGAGDGLINPPITDRTYQLERADIAVLNRACYNLYMDIKLLHDFSKLGDEVPLRSQQALYLANDIINNCKLDDENNLKECHRKAQVFFNNDSDTDAKKSNITNSGTYSASCCNAVLTVYAVGHCHIDTAWLWPYEETERKCGRSWASQLTLMKYYPNLKFACSQAQQYEWVEYRYPELFARIREEIKNGRFIPVGGSWVEMDANLPCGESFVRQLLYGQRYFQSKFGITCDIFWLPDTFGYSAQLPQILTLAGMKRFVTQKISWNLTNKFPHNTFWWEGIDGTRVLTHFPPADTYTSDLSLHDVHRTLINFKDRGRSDEALMLFGIGDGGGGPTAEMLEKATRLRSTTGAPNVVLSSPTEFFTQLEASESAKHRLCTWSGELYLELHRGTYTSQAAVKKGNRKLEYLLMSADLILAVASILVTNSQDKYNDNAVRDVAKFRHEIIRCWKLLLLNQFHDVIPGSSIGDVYKDTMRHYEDIESSLAVLTSSLISIITSHSNLSANSHSVNSNELQIPYFNPAAFTQTKVILHDDSLKLIKLPPMSYCYPTVMSPMTPVTITQTDANKWVLENYFLSATLNARGNLISCKLKQYENHEAIPEGLLGNQFVIFDDVPLFWDAWDTMEYHLETRQALQEVMNEEHTSSPLRATVTFKVKISDKSYITQTITLEADSPILIFDTSVEWRENRKFLKVEFPVNVCSHLATYDIQFGCVQRPTHFNTSWDQARFEVCAHKWCDLSEPYFGCALLNDSKYGHSVFGNLMCLSLLRAPKAPDNNCDMGAHSFRYAFYPHKGSFFEADVPKIATLFNSPIIPQVPELAPATNISWFSIQNRSCEIACIKLSESYNDRVVVRCFESHGAHSSARIFTSLPFNEAAQCNLLEQPYANSSPIPILPLDTAHLGSERVFEIKLSPFQIVSYLLYYK